MKKITFILLLTTFLSSCTSNNKSPNANEDSTSTKNTEQIPEKKQSNEPNLIEAGYEIVLDNHLKEKAIITLTKINTIKIAEDIYNIVIKVQIKNDMSSKLFISDIGWKLTDSNNIEIEESGIYDFDFNSFAPGTFFFTTVDSGFGKIEEVGYQVKKGTYYLHIGKINVGKIVVQE